MLFKKRRTDQSASLNRMTLRRTLFMMAVCGIVAFILLGMRLFQLQILDHDMYETAAMEQQLRQTTVSAQRGTIYDRNMNILAMSASVSNIYISPAEIVMNKENPAYIAQGLADILGLDYADVFEKTTHTDSWYSTVARKVEDDVADKVREFKENAGRDAQGNPVTDSKDHRTLTGVKIEEATKRYYPYSSLASHVIGFVGADDHGLAGLEYYYDDLLSGTDGRIVRATNAYGTDMMFTDFEDYYDAVDGQSIVTTIDETVQHYLESRLSAAAEDFGLRGGAAGIVMDVDTAEILGMASLGTFDLNDYLTMSPETEQEIIEESNGLTLEQHDALVAEKRAEMWRNKAITETYEPGSVFKIITLATGLETGAVTEDSAFYCGGSIEVLGRTDPLNCANIYGHGDINLTEAAMYSCNVAFVTIGMKIGAERFYDYLRAFGLFERTGVDLSGEASSLWWSEDVFFNKSNLSQLAAASFGQTFTITPLQLITAVSAVANGGYLMKPYVVKEVLNADGTVARQTEPTVVRQVISEETSRRCCDILEQVVGNRSGTGVNAYVAGYRVCGKTGTSEDVTYEVEHGTKRYICSFLGFAPADDPKVAVLVLLKDPDPTCGYGVSGGTMAAPTVGAILSDVLPYLGVEPDYGEGEAALVDQRVPRVVKKSLAEAKEALAKAGFEVKTVIGSGDAVTAQLPAPNSKVAAGSQVILYCGEEPSGELVEVPSLVGMRYADARIIAGWSDLYVRGEGTMMDSSSILTVSQSVEEGTMVDKGTVITVRLNDATKVGIF